MGRKDRRRRQRAAKNAVVTGEGLDPGAALTAALAHHQAGRVAQAERIYAQILAAQPNNADALNLLGVAAHQTGRHDRAITFIEKAVRHASANPHFLNNLGEAYRAHGRVGEAVACYRRALEIDPDYADAHANLGLALSEKGDVDGAVASYRRALKINADDAQTLGALGDALRKQGDPGEAVTCYRRALEIDPGLAEVHNNLGNALSQQGDLDGAVAGYRRALRIDPNLAKVHNNLGNALMQQDDPAGAVVCYRRALKIEPDYAEANNNLANALINLGNLDEALTRYRRAMEIEPDYVLAHFNYSLLLLLLGEFKEGWVEYEWRWKRGERKYRTRDFAQPLWDGSRLDGRTILLHAEGGLGNAIQFIRYVPLVAEYGGRIVVECHPMLIRLFKDVPGIDELIKRKSPLPPFDVHAPLMTLPMIFGTTVETIPADVAYLRAESGLVEKWRDRLSGFDGRKVGLCWQGNPKFPGDRWRSIPLRHFGVLLDDPSTTFINLHKGVGELQIQECGFEDRIVNYSSEVESLADTAAIMENLDLIITSDTLVAHLAGALGRPTWVLLQFVPEWRWLMDRDDMPWYPTMRLFRQRKLNDWEGVLMRAMRALEEYVTVE